jgi:hypothetical protein
VAHIQAGAGIVADSNPATEYQETLNKANAVLAAVAEADEQQPPRALAFGDESLDDRGGLALEALGLGGAGGEAAGRRVERGEAVGDHVLAPQRDGKRIGAGGTVTGEADLHGDSWFSHPPLGARPAAAKGGVLRHCSAGRPVR